MAQIILTACDPHQDQGQTIPGAPVSLADSQGRLVLVDLCAEDPARAAIEAVQALADKYGRNLDGSPVKRSGRPRATAPAPAPAADGDPAAPKSCMVCSQVFAHRRERDNHMRDDHDADPYADDPRATPCDFCKWKWVNVGTHVRSTHPEKWKTWRSRNSDSQLPLDRTA